MSVLIKGMEMPTSCWECPFERCALRALVDRHPDCPLVEVHVPHGRLIDADNLVSVLKQSFEDDAQNARNTDESRRMNRENNIRAILETYFTGFKEEIIDSAVNRLMELTDDGGIDINDFEERLASMPTIETEPVRRGRWQRIDGQSHIMECSECGSLSVENRYNYCPNCGAKMEIEDV